MKYDLKSIIIKKKTENKKVNIKAENNFQKFWNQTYDFFSLYFWCSNTQRFHWIENYFWLFKKIEQRNHTVRKNTKKELKKNIEYWWSYCFFLSNSALLLLWFLCYLVKTQICEKFCLTFWVDGDVFAPRRKLFFPWRKLFSRRKSSQNPKIWEKVITQQDPLLCFLVFSRHDILFVTNESCAFSFHAVLFFGPHCETRETVRARHFFLGTQTEPDGRHSFSLQFSIK